MKILIIGPAWVGDMVMSQSLYIAIKQQHPDAILHVMAPAWCLPLLERMPEVDKAIKMPIGHGDLKLKIRWTLGRELKLEGYDQAIVLPNSLKSALIPFFAGIQLRTGWKGESRYGLLNDLRNNKQAFPMMVERYLALAWPKSQMHSAADLPYRPIPKLQSLRETQLATMQRHELPQGKAILALCPGAEFGPAKRWPEEKYAEIASRWLQQGGEVWIFGSAKDQAVANTIREQLPTELAAGCHLLAGKTSLTEAIDLLAASDMVVSNDSGLMHIAAALQRPLVAVYGSTSTEYTPPLSDKARLVYTDISCRPCFKRECPLGHLNCLKELPAGQVWEAILSLQAAQEAQLNR